ncbi:MAG: hypothetical protein IPP67_04140 [Rhodospirillaceae bacterium]|nr:hypothetical protein [Rhodospirillaceae bacterium]
MAGKNFGVKGTMFVQVENEAQPVGYTNLSARAHFCRLKELLGKPP